MLRNDNNFDDFGDFNEPTKVAINGTMMNDDDDDFGNFDGPANIPKNDTSNDDDFDDFGDFNEPPKPAIGNVPTSNGDDGFDDFGDFNEPSKTTNNNDAANDDDFGDFGDFNEPSKTTNDFGFDDDDDDEFDDFGTFEDAAPKLDLKSDYPILKEADSVFPNIFSKVNIDEDGTNQEQPYNAIMIRDLLVSVVSQFCGYLHAAVLIILIEC